MYINIHSHHDCIDSDVRTVRNLIVGLEERILSSNQLYSAGIHPWYLDPAGLQSQMQRLEALLDTEGVKLLGECGLDRLKGPSLDIQKLAFEQQLKLAEDRGIPVLVHCVRCFPELLALHDQLKISVPLILHGFVNRWEIAEAFIARNFYFSFGTAIFKEGSNAARVLAQVPANRLFLETDDSDVSITGVYRRAAELRNIPLDQLKDIIFANWMSLNIGEL